jgi:hypothetical protein
MLLKRQPAPCFIKNAADNVMIKRWTIRILLLALLALCVFGWFWSSSHMGHVEYFRNGTRGHTAEMEYPARDYLEFTTCQGMIAIYGGRELSFSSGTESGFACESFRFSNGRLWPPRKPERYWGVWAGDPGARFGDGHSENFFWWGVGVSYGWIMLLLGALTFFAWRSPRFTRPGGFPVISRPNP